MTASYIEFGGFVVNLGAQRRMLKERKKEMQQGYRKYYVCEECGKKYEEDEDNDA